MTKIGRNHPCHCGNGKKYKHCHLILEEQEEAAKRSKAAWFGKLQPFARISSSGERLFSATIDRITKVENGIETVNLDKEITLSANAIREIGTIEERDSMALITFPKGKRETGEIRVKGNASISNNLGNCAINISGNKLEPKSARLFAIITKKRPPNEDCYCIDILFGERGKEESTNPMTGSKNRPHIAFYPDGNGNYIRLAGYKCTLEGDLTYNAINGVISPNKITVSLVDYSEKLVMEFTFDKTKQLVTLEKAFFV